MIWLTRCLLPRQRETNCRLGVGCDSLKFSFHSLLLLIILSQQAFVLVLSRIIQIFNCAIVISDKVWRTSTLFASPLWFLRNIALPVIPQTQNIAGGKISGFERKAFTQQNFPDSKVFGFKVPTLDSAQNLRRNDRIRPLVCKRQNQSGTKTFRINHESGTISSSINLV